jgi:hypothetical protein
MSSHQVRGESSMAPPWGRFVKGVGVCRHG